MLRDYLPQENKLIVWFSNTTFLHFSGWWNVFRLASLHSYIHVKAHSGICGEVPYP